MVVWFIRVGAGSLRRVSVSLGFGWVRSCAPSVLWSVRVCVGSLSCRRGCRVHLGSIRFTRTLLGVVGFNRVCVDSLESV